MGSNPTGATSLGDVAQRQEHSLVRRKIRRFESGRPRSPPRNPARCAGHDDFAAIEVGFEPSGSEPTPAKPASAHGGRGVTASIRGRDPRGSGSNPADRPPSCGRRALESSLPVTRCLALRWFDSTRPHPWGCSSIGRAPRLQRGGVGSTPTVSIKRLRGVNGKHAPFVRPRCGFNSCRRLFATRPRDCPWHVSGSITHADVAQ